MISTDFAKKHLVIDWDAVTDDPIGHYIDAATEYCEGLCNAPLESKARVKYFDEFSSTMCLGVNVTSVESLTYYDTDGNEQTLDAADIHSFRYRSETHISALPDADWPEGDRITVDYTAGFANPPSAVVQAVLLAVGHFYANREASTPTALNEMPHGISSLLAPYRQQAIR